LAVEEGWAVLCGPVLGNPTTTGNDSAHTNKNKRRKSNSGRYYYNVEEDEEEDDDFDNDGEDGYYYRHHGEDNDEKEAEKEKTTAPWQDALAKGTSFEIPTTAEEALRAQGSGGGVDKNATLHSNNDSNSEKEVKRADVHWTFPSTAEERDRYLIFKDLHSRGFRITGGSKFGSDYLLYPGDPTLYHAQFCVRLVQFKESILPALMASACRGSFQARKHLLYASAVMKNEESEKMAEDASSSGGGDVFQMLRGIKGKYETQYITFGPVDGFGKD